MISIRPVVEADLETFYESGFVRVMQRPSPADGVEEFVYRLD